MNNLNTTSHCTTPPKLVIVLPCYNEQGVLIRTIPVIHEHLANMIQAQQVAEDSCLLCVDDGSADGTWIEIQQLQSTLPQASLKALKLSRNFGHQNAVFAGMMFAKDQLNTEICISMDCDLQDDPNILPQMVQQYRAGYEIVYGVRNNRDSDTRSKRGFAELYYQILNRLHIDIIPNHADYRLLSQKALQALSQFQEANLFLRGMVPLLGFPATEVYYTRHERLAGYRKYNISRMIRLAVNGICSFTAIPLLSILWLGIIISLCSMAMGVWALCMKLFGAGSIPGWASTVVPLYFLGGIQLFTLGIIGIYISKIFDEVKRRPKYFIEKEL